MRAVPGPIWNARRKWMGNLLPALLYVPPVVFGVYWMASRTEVDAVGLGSIAAGLVVGWIALNFLGLFESPRMRRELQSVFRDKGESVPDDAVFVGFASPAYRSALDPHEDVGFLVLGADMLEFRGERHHLRIPKASVRRVGFRMNPHTLLGLGRWVVVEGQIDKKDVRLQIEPREKRTLLGNRRFSRQLADRIRTWAKAR